jgi:hypothetical protein
MRAARPAAERFRRQPGLPHRSSDKFSTNEEAEPAPCLLAGILPPARTEYTQRCGGTQINSPPQYAAQRFQGYRFRIYKALCSNLFEFVINHCPG